VCPVRATEELGQCVAKHIQAVRRLPAFREATAVVVVESNLPLIAESVRRTLEQSRVPRILVLCEDRKRARSALGAMDAEVRAGTRTTRQNKPEMVAAMTRLLQMRSLAFHAHFVVAQPERQPVDEPHPRDNILTELANFKREFKMPKTRTQAAYVRPTMAYSGRHPGGGRARDDYVMCLGISLLAYELFLASPVYAAYRT
jgi:hypothetical protein